MASLDLRVGNLTAAPGQKVQGYLDVPGTAFAVPVTLINGAQPGKTVVILSGIHGGEYAGIETAIRLAATLAPDELCGRVILAHPVNTAAFFERRQYVHPADGKNLNRVFPGRADGTASERIACAVSEQLFREADFVMDLHGGDIHEALTPFVVYAGGAAPQANLLAEAAARSTGLPYLIRADYPGTTFGTAGQMGIPAILVELGQCGRWSEVDVNAYLGAVHNVLQYLEVLPGAPEPPGREPAYLTQFRTTTAVVEGCWYPSVAAGDAVKAGDRLGELRDVFANVLHTCHADQDGVVLVLITSLAVGAGDPIFAIGSAPPAGGSGEEGSCLATSPAGSC